jgi:hypothetical protein
MLADAIKPAAYLAKSGVRIGAQIVQAAINSLDPLSMFLRLIHAASR